MDAAELASATPPPSNAAVAAPEGTRVPTQAERLRYPFIPEDALIRSLSAALAAPQGYARSPVAPDSFAAYLRGFPLRKPGSPVHSFRQDELHAGNDPRIAAVAELDVSPVDLQQCADTVIRLHAEWLWSLGKKDRIAYHFVSGDLASYRDYASGIRPQVSGNKVQFVRSALPADDRATFRRYLDLVFNYASTISLAQRGEKIEARTASAGDFFVLPGGPGHAIILLDIAIAPNGKRVALLGQGFMPAQDLQVLASGEPGLSPWFSLDGDAVDTPFWPEPFPWSALRRLPSAD